MFPDVGIAVAPLAVAALGVGLARRWRGKITPHKESRLSDLVPWSHLDGDGKTVVTSEGGAFRVYRLSGCIWGRLRKGKIKHAKPVSVVVAA